MCDTLQEKLVVELLARWALDCPFEKKHFFLSDGTLDIEKFKQFIVSYYGSEEVAELVKKYSHNGEYIDRAIRRRRELVCLLKKK